MFELVFLSGARAGAVVPAVGKQIAGRSPETHLEVPDPNVSRQHCVFEFDGSDLLLRDNNSSNGTYVNEHRLSEQVLVRHGDVVRIGETRMRVQRRTQADSSMDAAHSSVFGFHDQNNDVNQSLSMSVIDLPNIVNQDASVLSSRLNALIWVSDVLATITKLDKLYAPILKILFEVFPQAERGFLMLGDTWDSLEPKAMRDRHGRDGEQIAVSSSLCKAALERKELIIYSDSGPTDFDQGMSLVSLNIRSAMVIPLMVKEELLGLLVIDTSDRSHSFSQSDMELAATVCRQVSVAIKNALLINKVEENMREKRNFMRFLPRPVVEQAMDGQIDIDLGGKSYDGTVFFADIIGFTRMSERQDPGSVIAMMNEFFNKMVPCIEGESGAIDKFMGDCIMAFWGIPFPVGNPPVISAITSGLNMQNALWGLNATRQANGDEPLSIGIGLTHGSVVAGNIGSEDRLEYTILGNAVNTASRIQSIANASQVLIGEDAFTEIDEKLCAIQLKPVNVKNKEKEVHIYSIRGLGMGNNEMLLHLPVNLGATTGVLIRRLADDTFTLLHDARIDLKTVHMHVTLCEYESLALGTPHVVAQLPNEIVDGPLQRSVVTFTEKTLTQFLDSTLHVCEKEWAEMARGS